MYGKDTPGSLGIFRISFVSLHVPDICSVLDDEVQMYCDSVTRFERKQVYIAIAGKNDTSRHSR